MNPIPEAKVMRIYMSNTDMFKYSLLYETIVFAAKRYGLSGATVIKGVMGFGSSSIVNSIHFWEFNEKLPVVVEIIDTPAKIDSFAQKIEPWFNKIRYGCLITIDTTHIYLQKQGTKKI